MEGHNNTMKQIFYINLMEYGAQSEESAAACAHKENKTESKQRRRYFYQKAEEYKQMPMCEYELILNCCLSWPWRKLMYIQCTPS